MREKMVCPVCATECGHVSKDGGDTWQCDLGMSVHDGEADTA